ncbi:putative lon protease protein 4, chloroplastic/mitochondrial [Cardamine amara subsp. amara]|uniref:Lon protease protein 4, chloroplastic/mitochondrial n=1 Tax=Cardamine amara subsp. amara TaxID=228776 RepID=A0ABD0ZBU8_CARAN
MPGKMVQCLKSLGTENPLVLIDEIDKLGVRCHNGDPASAMLELLDPEQNANFLDDYLDVTIDLSKVLFVCTANMIDTIPSPLLDRMEVITLSRYITDEKMHIARDYLEKTAHRDCGVKPDQVDVSDAALLSLIENYCREARVRNLHKHIEKIYHRITLKLVRKGASAKVPEISDDVTEDTKSLAKTDLESPETSTKESKTEQSGAVAETVEKFMIDESNLSDYVGKPIFHAEKLYEQTPVGVVMV